MANPIHMVGSAPVRLKLDKEVRTRCGLTCTPVRRWDDKLGDGEPNRITYSMLSPSGGSYVATTRQMHVTCEKCGKSLK